MSLLKAPTYKDAPDGQFVVVDPMVYKFRGQTITVPEGFVTDFASIPWGMRNLFRVNSKHKRPALLHDYLYSKAAAKLGHSRRDADREFLKFMIAVGVGGVRRYLMYKAVRAFGGLSWRQR